MVLEGFQTARLDVAKWPANARDSIKLRQSVAQILSPNVTQHLPAGLHYDGTPGDLTRWIDQQAQSGAMHSVSITQSRDMIGQLILARFASPDQPTQLHIGYLLGESVWGQGFGSELIRGLVDALIQLQEPMDVLGGVVAANPASAKVLEKAGFQRSAALSDPETDMFLLEIRP